MTLDYWIIAAVNFLTTVVIKFKVSNNRRIFLILGNDKNINNTSDKNLSEVFSSLNIEYIFVFHCAGRFLWLDFLENSERFNQE